MDQIKIGKLISRLRKQQNMTQLNLAEKLGVTDRAISKWETGRGMPDVSLMKPLCEILGINVTELLNGELMSEADCENKREETVYEVLTITQQVKKRYLGFRIMTIIILSIMSISLIFMSFSGIRGEGHSVFTAIKTQKAEIVSNLIEEEKFEKAVKYIGFSEKDKKAAQEKWVKEMKALFQEVKIESIDISSITLDDYFPKGIYLMTVYDFESQVSHIYEGFYTIQNGGIAFAQVNIPYGTDDMTREKIGNTLNDVFSTYNPG